MARKLVFYLAYKSVHGKVSHLALKKAFSKALELGIVKVSLRDPVQVYDLLGLRNKIF
jgi:hypothetical protein